jgi:hypothetical protein
MPEIDHFPDHVVLDIFPSVKPAHDFFESFLWAITRFPQLDHTFQTIFLAAAPEVAAISFDSLLDELVEETIEIVLLLPSNNDRYTPFDKLAKMLLLPQSFFHNCLDLTPPLSGAWKRERGTSGRCKASAAALGSALTGYA